MKTRREEFDTRYPDLFVQVQVPAHQQRLFIQLWHRHPAMPITELSRQARISRPTCYKLIKLLEARGDVRGEICNNEFLSETDIKIPAGEGSLGDLSHFRRQDLLRRIAVHEDFARVALKLLARYDRDFVGILEEDLDLPKLLSRLERKLKAPAQAPSRNANGNPNVNPRYRHLT